MKNILFIIALVTVAISCNNKNADNQSKTSDTPQEITNADAPVSDVSGVTIVDSAKLKAKEDSIVKAHGHKH